MSNLLPFLWGRAPKVVGKTIAVLDVGTSKIACIIARDEGHDHLRVIGIGHQKAEGIRGGTVAQMEPLQHAISRAVAAAEQMAGLSISKVSVNISGAHIHSQRAHIDVTLNGHEVTDAILRRALTQGQHLVAEDKQGRPLELIHCLPIKYQMDGQGDIRDPLGMIGDALEVQMLLISAPFGLVRTLATAITRCHLEVERLIAGPYASGLACLVEDEIDLGCLAIDMGAGTTSFGVFVNGALIHADGIAVGGSHVTNDIARGLTTSLADAERIKTLYGGTQLTPLDGREMVEIPQVGEETTGNMNIIPRSDLIQIIEPRIEEIFELVREKLDHAGMNAIAGRRVVLCGGGSNLPGVRETAQRILEKQVRLGHPLRITRPDGNHQMNLDNLVGVAREPAFAVGAGMLAITQMPDMGAEQTILGDFNNRETVIGRVGIWMKQNF